MIVRLNTKYCRNCLVISVFFVLFIVSLVYGASLVYQIKTQNVFINTTATKLPITPLVGREYLLITNKEGTILYVGASNVNTTNGTPLRGNETYYGEWKSTIDVYGIVASGGTNATVEEGK